MDINIRVQSNDFSQGELYNSLAVGDAAGAVVTFVGRVRDFQAGNDSAVAGKPQRMWLEHYPGMTEKVLRHRVTAAGERWPLFAATVVHRVGELAPGEQIVFVGVSAAHRKDAFEASQYLIDFLKTEAPFWKREGERWVEAKATDEAAAHAWERDA